MSDNNSGSTARLMQLCFGYFFFYIITGVGVKFFLKTGEGFPGLPGMEYLFYSTLASSVLVTAIVLIMRWYRLDSVRKITVCGITMPNHQYDEETNTCYTTVEEFGWVENIPHKLLNKKGFSWKTNGYHVNRIERHFFLFLEM